MGWLLTKLCDMRDRAGSSFNWKESFYQNTQEFHTLLATMLLRVTTVFSVCIWCVYQLYTLYIVCADHKVANYNVKSSFQRSQTNNKRRHWYHSAECCVLWFPHCGLHRTKQHINIILELLQPQTWFKRLNMRAPCSMLLSWKSNIYRCQNQNGPFPPKDVTQTWDYHFTVDTHHLYEGNEFVKMV